MSQPTTTEMAMSIGQDKANQDPCAAIESASGKYTDSVAAMPEAAKVLQVPAGPDKSPFKGMRSV